MESLFKVEAEFYEQNIKKTFAKMTQPIKFTISDLLRGKCYFAKIEDINECCKVLKERIRKDDKFKLIEVKNRLKKGTADIMLKILVRDKVMTELQLAVHNKIANYEFSHKLY